MHDNFACSDNICLLVDDQPQIREALTNVIKRVFPDLLIMTAASLGEVNRWLDERRRVSEPPRLVFSLIDIGLPDGSGISLLRNLREIEPESLSVIITIFAEERILFEALAAGAFGYILKDENKSGWEDSLRRIESREPPMSPSIARRLLTHFHSSPSQAPSKPLLTPRETQTLTLLVRGFTVPESASQLGLSAQTVSGYVKAIYQKLRVSNRAEATREAIRQGIC